MDKLKGNTQHKKLSKQQRHNKSHVFSDRYSYTGSYQIPTRIDHIYFNSKSIDSEKVDIKTKSFKKYLKEGHISWFNVSGLSNSDAINKMLDDFGLDAIDGKDILTPHHVVKINDYDDKIIVVMGACFFENPTKVNSEHVCIIAKENLVLSFSEIGRTLFDDALQSLKTNVMGVRKRKSGMLLAFLLNSVFSRVIETALYIEENLEDIEKVLLDTDINKPNMGKRIQQSRHANLIIRKNTKPLKEEFQKLLKAQNGITDKSMTRIFSELGDQLEYIIETSENSKEILSSLDDLYVSHNDLKTNAIMKRLTVVSTLFIPITFLVGLWGMNFKFMPELEWRFGYLFAWGVLLVTALFTWIFMKKKKWF